MGHNDQRGLHLWARKTRKAEVRVTTHGSGLARPSIAALYKGAWMVKELGWCHRGTQFLYRTAEAAKPSMNAGRVAPE